MPYQYNRIESDSPMAEEEAYAMPEISDVFYDGDLQEAMALECATVLEIELENDSNSVTKETAEPPERKKLKRELEREALTRLEEAAKTQDDFQNVTYIWNRLDSNRKRMSIGHSP